MYSGITDTVIRVAHQRRVFPKRGTETCIRRASIESTVRGMIHPFGGHLCKLSVRGKSQITTITVLSAAMLDLKRIARYLFEPGVVKRAVQPETP